MSCNFVQVRDVGDFDVISKKQKNFKIISTNFSQQHISNRKERNNFNKNIEEVEKKNSSVTSKRRENSLTVKKDSLKSKVHLKSNENSLKYKEDILKYSENSNTLKKSSGGDYFKDLTSKKKKRNLVVSNERTLDLRCFKVFTNLDEL